MEGSELGQLIKKFVFELSDDPSDVGGREEVIETISSNQLRSKNSDGLSAFSLPNIIVQLEECLLSDNETYRMRGTLLIARLLQKMGENFSMGMESYSLNKQTLNLLVIFICKRLKDYTSLIPCLDALHAIIVNYSNSLDSNNGDLIWNYQIYFR